MNNSSRIISLSEAKIQAQILLKNLNSTESELKTVAVAKIDNYLNRIGLTLTADKIQLKHCLACIADQYGFDSWANCKFYFEQTQLTAFTPRGGFFNQWFSNYSEAKQILKDSKGYLLPYRQQFFICESGYIEYLSLNPADPNWEKIGYNWVEPQDISAWQELNNAYVHQ